MEVSALLHACEASEHSDLREHVFHLREKLKKTFMAEEL